MTSGEIGMESQAQGLAAAIGLSVDIKTVRLSPPWSWLPGHWVPNALGALSPSGDQLSPPWPRVLVTCGRRSVAVSLAIRKASRGQTFTVHIQNPLIPPRYFDLVAAPAHDGITGANVVITQGAVHRLTHEGLAAAAQKFAPRFIDLPHPRVAVLIGGTNSCYELNTAIAAQLGDHLAELARNQGVGLMVTTSRRTGAENVEILRAKLAGLNCFFWAGEGENPYFAMLGSADHILATPDSVSMVSEACFTGNPVQIIPLAGGNKRFRAFHDGMQRAGFTRPFTGSLEDWVYRPLDETARVAALIRTRLSERNPS